MRGFFGEMILYIYFQPITIIDVLVIHFQNKLENVIFIPKFLDILKKYFL